LTSLSKKILQNPRELHCPCRYMNELTVLLGTRLSKLREVTYVIQEITATKKTLKTLKKKKKP
jgi:hypothetical protein